MRPKGERNRLFIVMGVVGAVVAGFMAYIAWAQERGETPKRQPILIGWIDLDRLLKGLEEYKRQSEIFDRMLQLRDQALRQLGQHFLFLSHAEWNEAVQLLGKEKPTAEDNKRIEELRKLSQRREARWKELSGKQALTAEERNELEQLGRFYTSNRQGIEELRRKWIEELQRHEQEVISKLEEKIFKMAKEVAQRKEFDIVLAYVKDQPPSVIYVRPDLDLTDTVTEALNKAFRARRSR